MGAASRDVNHSLPPFGVKVHFPLSNFPLSISCSDLVTEQQLDPSLSDLFKQAVTLDHVCDADCFTPKVKAVKQFPVQRSKKLLFLRLVGSYRCFCQNFLVVVSP